MVAVESMGTKVPLMFATLTLAAAIWPSAGQGGSAGSSVSPDNTIAGRVVDGSDGRPISDVRVSARLLATRQQGLQSVAQGDGRTSMAVLTADDGTFRLSGLSVGEYILSARKTGYVTTYLDGSTGLGRVVLQGKGVSGLTLKMSKGAVVSGLALDGPRPLAGLWVEAFRLGVFDGRPAFESPLGIAAQTNEEGAYRLVGLAPGSYLIRVSGRPVGAVDADKVSLNATRETVYYPSAQTALSAQLVGLAAGEERFGVDFHQERAPSTFEISGEVRNSGCVASRVSVVTEVDHTFVPKGTEVGTSAVSSNGSFQIVRVSPGAYRVVGRCGAVQRGSGRAGLIAWYDVPILVVDRSVTNVVIHPNETTSVAGSVVVEGGAQGQIGQATVNLWPRDVRQSPVVEPVSIDATGRFEFVGLIPGEYILQLQSGHLYSETITQYGRELGAAINVPAGGLKDVKITASTVPSTLRARTVDSTGKPATATVFMFPVREGLPMTTNVIMRLVDQDGSLVLNLAPGEYLIGAVTGRIPEAWRESSFLQGVQAGCERLSVPKRAVVERSLVIRHVGR